MPVGQQPRMAARWLRACYSARALRPPPARSFATYDAATDDAILNQMKIYALKQQTGVSMRTLVDTGHGRKLKLADLNMTEDDVSVSRSLSLSLSLSLSWW